MAAVILSPLDILRTRLQSSSGRHLGMQPQRLLVNIVRKEGVLALWRGLWPTIFGVGPARALYFGGYNLSKRYLGPEGFGMSGTPLHLLGAATAGVFSNTVMSPWWVIRLRLQLQVTPIEPFWRRWFSSAKVSPVLAAPAAGAAAVLSANTPAAAAGLAASAATAASAASSAGAAAAAVAVPYKGVADAALRIYREEGWRTFYRGLSASYLGVVETALQFAIYGELKRLVLVPKLPPAALVVVDGAGSSALQAASSQSSASASTSSVLATRSADRTPFAASAGPAAAAAIGGTRTAVAVAATGAPVLHALARTGGGSGSVTSPSAVGAAAGAAATMGAGGAGGGLGLELSRYMPAQAWAFWLSAVSKLFAAAASYPHEVLRTRMREQMAGADGRLKYSGIVQATRLIVAEEGMRGLYGGMGVHLLRTVPNAAILLLVVETMVGGDV